MLDNKNSAYVLVIVGPTAVGKTDLAIELAKVVNGEIISADSRLFYRGMDIGTAKPTIMQRKIVKHYLIDVADPNEIWSLSVFQKRANESIKAIQENGKVAILVGGTGQYVRAIIEGWLIPPQKPDEEFRKYIEAWGKQIGAESLHQKLSLIDPVAAQKIDPENLRRSIRAFEVIFSTGKLFSEQRRKEKPEQKFWVIGLNRPRPELYARIDLRIENMFANGLIEETQKLLMRGIALNSPNLSAIGYQEVCGYLAGEITLEEAKDKMKKKTREFVRRQANWFKPNDINIHWYEMNEVTLPKIIKDLRVANIIG